MTLTGQPLVLLICALAAAAPAAVTLWWRRTARRSWLASVRRLGALLLCQALAVSALFLWVNNQYGFYNSWSDLAGRSGGTATITAGGLVKAGQGRVQVLNVTGGPGTNGNHQVLAWLPPQYDQPQYRDTRFPVMMVLPGQPSTPSAMFRHYNFGAAATTEINAGRMQPFVAVFPPLMTSPPRDTECTDVPNGPQAETWLSRYVFNGVRRDLRVDSRPWTTLGWSTGAFCSAKLVLRFPQQYQAAAGLGGYYAPVTDSTTGKLFKGKTSREENSPSWLYRHGGLHHRKLLVVAGRQDTEAYRPSQQFLDLTAGDPGVSSLLFPTGGHNYHNYALYLPQALQWLGTNANA
ncbi:MAG: S-formylglutathione hydrolase FrmB [Friedmanniella sp.]|nr:S-formylglutathione hydrolase FrmB [Friedmanniella sp.]